MIAKAGAVANQMKGGLAVEINLSCPNIAGKPPIAYDFDGMKSYLATVFKDGKRLEHASNLRLEQPPLHSARALLKRVRGSPHALTCSQASPPG